MAFIAFPTFAFHQAYRKSRHLPDFGGIGNQA
jgi:hypothetical protein